MPISRHQHIKIIIHGYCLICRNSEETQIARIAKRESIIYKTTLKLSGETLEEVLPLLKKTLKEPKRIRGKYTLYKCSECVVSIYRLEMPC